MESEVILDDKNIIVMKLLHYFITEKNYNPIILQGVQNEIWLENLDEDVKVIRIVSGYIHNDEQFRFDVFKTKRILKKIKKKTFSFNINVFSFFLNMGDNVTNELSDGSKFLAVNAQNEAAIKKDPLVTKTFPDLKKNLTFHEKGVELFMKITKDINEHNIKDANKMEKIFSNKYPFVTYLLIAINVICFIVPILFGQYDKLIAMFCIHGPSIRAGQIYRLLTGIFLHGGIMHLAFNCYALYVIGSQLESLMGKFKYIIIYLFSGITGALFSMTFGGSYASIGASGAIFGLMGSLLYFGYHYRVFLGNVVKSQILPLIVINLVLGFMMSGVDNFAHIGGLIGGALVTVALGVKEKSSLFEMINGWIVTIIFLIFTYYMAFVLAGR